MNREKSANEQPEQKRSWPRYIWIEWVRPLLIIAVVLGSMRSALADWNDVPTGSMKPTILIGDRVVVNKLAYDLKIPFTTRRVAQWGDPERGDIVVFFSPYDGRRLVKRVVGVPGDTVAVEDDILVVNGQAARYEPIGGLMHAVNELVSGLRHPVIYLPGTQPAGLFGPVTVPDGSYFVMGDNRDESFDSRFFGFVERDRIVGEATAVAFSLDHDRWFIPRPDRWFQGLD